MKILITGARGTFATGLIPRLAVDGHELVLFDLEPMSAPEGSTAVQGDIRDAGLLTHIMQGCDAVVHAAALHSTARDIRNYDDCYSVNVTGLHNVLRAMSLNGVKAIVYSSCDAVYGDGSRGHLVIDEATPTLPVNFYAETKLLGEEMLRFYSRKSGVRCAALRYGRFVSADWRTEGLARLNNGLDREDVAQANQLALGAVMEEGFGFEVFQIQSAKPFVETDWPTLTTDPEKVLEYYYPGSTQLLHDNDLRVPYVHHRYDITKAITQLGYDPQHNFEQFLSRLRSEGRHHF
jgi:nucleoside-diphosphate-sugar epimerase